MSRTWRMIALVAPIMLVAIAEWRTGAVAEESKTETPTWKAVGLCGGGGLMNPVVSPHDPQFMLIESDMGGRYISRNGGKTWRMLHHRQIGAACRGATPLFHPVRNGIIYALVSYSASTLRATKDHGKTWHQWPKDRQPQAGLISCMYIDRVRPERLVVATDKGKILFSSDEGKTWIAGSGVTGRVWQIVAVHGSPKEKRAYFVGTPDGVFFSEDDGKSFAKRVKGLPDTKLRGFAGGSNEKATVLYAAVACKLEDGKLTGGMYVSTDRGQNWQRCMNPKIDVSTKRASQWARGDLPQYSHLVANDADPRRAYVYCGGTSFFPPNHSTIYRTDDTGKSWQPVWFVDPRFKENNAAPDWQTSYMGQSWCGGPIDMTISPNDPDVVMRSDAMYFYYTRDGGKSWTPGHALQANDEKEDKKVWWRCNGLVNTTTWNYYVDPHETNRHYIAYTDIGFARSEDSGKSWRWWGPGERHGETTGFTVPRKWINTCYELAIDPDVPGRIWGIFSGHHDIPDENSIWRGTGKSKHKGGVCVSKDFGVTWKAQREGLPEAPGLSIILDSKSPKEKRTLYACIYDNGVFKSDDGGAKWVKKSKGLGHPENTRVCRIHLHSDGTLFVLITGMRIPAGGPLTKHGVGLYKSSDKAETWEVVQGSNTYLYPRDFAVDPADSNLIYIGTSDLPRQRDPATKKNLPARPEDQQGGLVRTKDGGKTWERILRKRNTHFGAYFHPVHKDWIYATCTGWSGAPEGSLFLSKDKGKTWLPFNGLPFAQIHRVHFDPKQPEAIYVTTFGGSVWKGPVEPGRSKQ